MSGAVGDYVAENLVADERQVSDQIGDLWAHKFIIKTQRRIDHALAGQDDRVLLRRAADQALLAHGFGFMQKSESAGGSNVRDVMSVGQDLGESLASDERMGEINGVGNRIIFRRIDPDE